MRLLLLILMAGSALAAPLYFAVSPDSHFVVLDRTGDTLWKSSAAGSGSTDSLLAAWGILGAPVWLKTGDSIKVDSGTVGTWGDLRWLSLLGKAADATGADSADLAKLARDADSLDGHAASYFATAAAAAKAQDTANRALAGPDTVGTRSFGGGIWLALAGKAADASGADSADVGVVSRSCTGNAATASTAAANTGLWKMLDTTYFVKTTGTGADSTGNHLVVQATRFRGALTGDVTGTADSAVAAGRATKIASDGDSAKVWTMTSPSTQGWLAAAGGGGGGGDSTWLIPQTLTDGATISWNIASGGQAKVMLGGNRTLANPTNVSNGKHYTLKLIQDGTGTRTLTWGANYRFPGAVAPTLTATRMLADIFTFLSDEDSLLFCTGAGFSYATGDTL